MSEEGSAKGATAVRSVTLSSTEMKYLIVFFFGDRSVRDGVGLGFGTIVVATVLGILRMRWSQWAGVPTRIRGIGCP